MSAFTTFVVEVFGTDLKFEVRPFGNFEQHSCLEAMKGEVKDEEAATREQVKEEIAQQASILGRRNSCLLLRLER